MKEKTRTNILLGAIIILVITICIMGFTFKRNYDNVLSKIESLKEKIEDIESAEKTTEEMLRELSVLDYKITELIEYNQNNDKDQIILNYQQAQERYENNFNMYLGVLGVAYTIFIVSIIVVPYLNRRKLDMITKQAKKMIEEQEALQEQLNNANKVQEKYNLMQEIETIFNIYNNDKTNYAILEVLIEKIDELLNDFQLGELERCTYLLYKAHDLHRLDMDTEAESAYNQACVCAKNTESDHIIADSYYKKALFYKATSENIKAIESIDEALNYLLENIVYLKLKKDLCLERFKSTDSLIEECESKEEIVEIGKLLWDVKDDGDMGAYGELVNLYDFVNNYYDEDDKEDMDWICSKFDNMKNGKGLGEGDKRFVVKLNVKYVEALSPEKQEEYINRGYANPL